LIVSRVRLFLVRMVISPLFVKVKAKRQCWFKNMEELTLIQKITVWVIPVLFAITVHEVAHGWVAKYYGDKTAWMLGRLTLNPLKHIDPVGTILVPGLMLAFTGFVFGWAKPVPVNIRNLHHPKHDMAIVALAGPSANFLMALG